MIQKAVVVNNNLVVLGNGRVCTLDNISRYIEPHKTCIIGVVPILTNQILASQQTLDVAISSQFPQNHTFSTEILETNNYQVFAIEDILFEQLKKSGQQIQVVPYSVAVRSVINNLSFIEDIGILERTKIFLKRDSIDSKNNKFQEIIVMDCIEENFIITALRGKEILTTRHVRGGNPDSELQRTMAVVRMEEPLILTLDRDLALQLKAHGFKAIEPEQYNDGLYGWPGLEKAAALRFLTQAEVAREQTLRTRSRSISTMVASLIFLALSLIFFIITDARLSNARHVTEQLIATKQTISDNLEAAYADKFGELARERSIQLHNELFDLAIALPSQVVLMSLEKNYHELKAIVERRPGATPFSRTDLKQALAASPYFFNSKISEEYEDHLVRYILTVNLDEKTSQDGP